MVSTLSDGATERLGKYRFETTFAKGGDEDVDRLRARRRRALTNWLLSEWRREHGRGLHHCPTGTRQFAGRN